MSLKISDISTTMVNGPGIRLGIWFQGCEHKCKGCFSPHTHDVNGGNKWTVPKLVKFIKDELHTYKYSGISILGGDPLLQAEELKEFLKAFKNVDVILWTGFQLDEICSDDDRFICLKYVNTLIEGRFNIDLPVDPDENEGQPLRGSTNQRVLHLADGEIIGEDSK